MKQMKNHVWVECPCCKHKYWFNKMWLDEEPERIKNHKKLFCPNSNEHYKIIREKKFNSLPKEKRQEILDLIREGLTIGEVRKKVNLDLDTVCIVITKNIESAHYLRSETK